MKYWLLIGMIAFSLIRADTCPGSEIANVDQLYIRFPDDVNEFSILNCPDSEYLGMNWLYVARLECYEAHEGSGFRLFVAKEYRTGDYAVALYGTGALGGGAKFDRITPDEKIALAHVKKVVDKAMANEIYNMVAKAIILSKGHGRRGRADGSVYQITIYSADRGFLCGEAIDRPPRSTVDRLMTFASLVRRYMTAEVGSMGEKEIEKEIMSARL
jgi:hypothetical protein